MTTKKEIKELTKVAEDTTIGEAIKTVERLAEAEDIKAGQKLLLALVDVIDGDASFSAIQRAIASLFLARVGLTSVLTGLWESSAVNNGRDEFNRLTLMNDTELDALHKKICEGIELLHEQGETGDGGRARTLFYAWAAFLDQRGIIDHLKAAANWMAAQNCGKQIWERLSTNG